VLVSLVFGDGNVIGRVDEPNVVLDQELSAVTGVDAVVQVVVIVVVNAGVGRNCLYVMECRLREQTYCPVPKRKEGPRELRLCQ
jgi:hypothetical protein